MRILYCTLNVLLLYQNIGRDQCFRWMVKFDREKTLGIKMFHFFKRAGLSVLCTGKQKTQFDCFLSEFPVRDVVIFSPELM